MVTGCRLWGLWRATNEEIRDSASYRYRIIVLVVIRFVGDNAGIRRLQLRGVLTNMETSLLGMVLGLAIGAGCRFFDIPSPAPPRLIGAALLIAMTLGFVVADHTMQQGAIPAMETKP